MVVVVVLLNLPLLLVAVHDSLGPELVRAQSRRQDGA